MKDDELMNNELDIPIEEVTPNEISPEPAGDAADDVENGTASVENAEDEQEQLTEPGSEDMSDGEKANDDEALTASGASVSEEDGEDTADEAGAEVEPEECGSPIDDGDETEEHPALPSSEKAKKAESPDKPRRVESLFEFVELFVFTLAALFIITSFFFRYSVVDGTSMQNTLQDEERLLLTNFLYTPKCGDVVVIHDKTVDFDIRKTDEDPVVKRVIAVGGQTVKFTKTDVYVDGVKLDEPYVYFSTSNYEYSVYPSAALMPIVTDMVEDEYYEIKVPEGHIFVMGDHRTVSADSRAVGTLHEDAIIGKVVLRFYPFSTFGKIE